MTARILIIDDELAIRRLVRGAIERSGEHADEAANAAEGLAFAKRAGCELVLLDLGLPDRDGLELVPLLKALGRSVIVLTARDETEEKVAALDLGADDYVVKPFDTDELLARIRVSLRHHANSSTASGALNFGGIMFDAVARKVTRDGSDVHLSRKEFALLAELVRHPGRVVTHTSLLKTIWGEAHTDDVEYLRVTVRSLRQKLEADPARPSIILNDPGVGYRVVTE